MRRHWLGPVGIALWTLWLAAVMAVPTVLRLCPMHDVPPRAAAAERALPHPADHADHAKHNGLPDHRGRSCHCPGECSAAVGEGLPSAGIALALVTVAAPSEPLPPAPRPPLTAPGHLLPFANGPPAALG